MKLDSRYLRPADVDLLLADASKTGEKVGCKPTITFPQVVARMVDADLELAARKKRL